MIKIRIYKKLKTPEKIMNFITTEELHKKLIDSGIINTEGNIIFDYFNVKVEVHQKSAIGDLFQEWLGKWMMANQIYYRTNPNSQEFPDYYLHKTSNTEDLLEIKVFDADAGVAFDVANFDTYTRSLLTQPHKVNADYLIFSYTLRDGKFSIKQIWKKKIWEITGAMRGRPINLQVKQNVFVNIRPVKWYSDRAEFKPFNNRDAFLIALNEAIIMNPKETGWDKHTWLDTVKKAII
jgi:hypothetical protein